MRAVWLLSAAIAGLGAARAEAADGGVTWRADVTAVGQVAAAPVAHPAEQVSIVGQLGLRALLQHEPLPALRLRANVALLGAAGLSLQDLRSSLTATLTSPAGDFALELFPLDSQRVRTTFDWANTWRAQVPIQTFAPTPAGVLSWTWAGLHAWCAVRAASTFDVMGTPVVRWSTLGGVGVERGAFTAEVRGGRLALPGELPAPHVQRGATLQLTWRHGGGVGPAWDPVTYGRDPERFERRFDRDLSAPPRAAWVAVEAGFVETAAVPQLGEGADKLPGAFAELQLRLRIRSVRVFGTARLHTWALLDSGAGGALALAAALASATPSLATILGVDGSVPVGPLWVAPGLLLRLNAPARVRVDRPLPSETLFETKDGPAEGVRDTPRDGTPLVASAQASVQLGLGASVSVVATADLEVRFEAVAPAPALRSPARFRLLGQLALQARF